MLNQHDVFAGTLWENITMGDETIDINSVSRLVHVTGLSSFLASSKEGFDTRLHPAGKRLPSNVVQKILLVRALAHKPKLLLMEEPWQGFDDETSRQFQHFLLTEVEATVIVATNDSHFIQQCNQNIALT